MEYDPVKKKFRDLIRKKAWRRKLFFKFMHLILLRSWYLKKEIRQLPFDKNSPLAFLDAGSGFGNYACFLSRQFPNAQILGLDIEEEHVTDAAAFARAIDEDRLHFQMADITQMDYKNAFDFVLSVDVLEHIEDDKDLLKRFFIALKKGGHFIASTPSIYRVYKDDCDFVDEHYRDGYSIEDMQVKCKEAGFNTVAIHFGYGFWGDLSWRLGIRNTMKLVSLGIGGKFLAPFYFVLIFPLTLIFMCLDYISPGKLGTGMIVHAVKS